MNYEEGRQLIYSCPRRCSANTLLCVKRKMHISFYRMRVLIRRHLLSLLTAITNTFESERKIVVFIRVIRLKMFNIPSEITLNLY